MLHGPRHPLTGARALIRVAAALLGLWPGFLWPGLSAADGAAFVGRFTWDRPEPHFGGLSGLEIAAGGTRFLAISDLAQVIEGRILREGDTILAVEPAPPGIPRLLGIDRLPLGEEDETDSEGLARLPDGRLAVSFEHGARVWVYPAPLAVPEALPLHPDFAGFWANGGLEALAAAADGTLYTVPERRPWPWGARRVYRFSGGAWETFGTLAPDGPFAPVGADVGPDGRLYLLERRYVPFLGFASRVRRFRIGAAGLEEGEVLLRTPLGTHDNLEGIAVWRASDGRLVLTMVSDDNFSRWQRTEIVEYSVPGDVDRADGTR